MGQDRGIGGNLRSRVAGFATYQIGLLRLDGGSDPPEEWVPRGQRALGPDTAERDRTAANKLQGRLQERGVLAKGTRHGA